MIEILYKLLERATGKPEFDVSIFSPKFDIADFKQNKKQAKNDKDGKDEKKKNIAEYD